MSRTLAAVISIFKAGWVHPAHINGMMAAPEDAVCSPESAKKKQRENRERESGAPLQIGSNYQMGLMVEIHHGIMTKEGAR